MEDKLYTTEETAKIFANFLGDTPCCFNDFGELTIDDEWCEMHCGKVSDTECWVHALAEGWLE